MSMVEFASFTAFSAFHILMFFARCIITYFSSSSPLEMPRVMFAWLTSTYLAEYYLIFSYLFNSNS
jgi:hypothetical protein